MDYRCDTPVLLLIFNRPEAVERVFRSIQAVQPPQLFIAADGPRADKPGEAELCQQARAIVEQVDWNCEVKTLFRDENLGCQKAVSSAIDWFFEQVEEGIILEDDCVAHPSFFPYCQQLLEKYKDEQKVMCISGDNFQNGNQRGEGSYYFSTFNHCWGWATWRRAWQHFDLQMNSFAEFKKQHKIKDIWSRWAEQMYWMDTFQDVYDGKVNSWAYIWTYTCWLHKGLTCLPNVNLVSNIGYEGAHTHAGSNASSSQPDNVNLPVQAMQFPLRHPKKIWRDFEADVYTSKHNYKISLIKMIFIRLLKKLGLLSLAGRIRLKLKNMFR